MTCPIKTHADFPTVVDVVTQSQTRLNIISTALFVSALGLSVLVGVGVVINPLAAIAFIPLSALVYFSGNCSAMKNHADSILYAVKNHPSDYISVVGEHLSVNFQEIKGVLGLKTFFFDWAVDLEVQCTAKNLHHRLSS